MTVPDIGLSLPTVAHIIQTALTPVFLLTGIATLLNVFSTRLARVAGRGEQAVKALENADEASRGVVRIRLIELHRRALALDLAVVLAAMAGAATCSTILLLFLRATGGWIGYTLFVAFGFAILCALGAIVAYASEMLMAGTGIRGELAQGRYDRHSDET